MTFSFHLSDKTYAGTHTIQKNKPIVQRVNIGNNHYWVMLPADFNKSNKYPVIIYLHGRKYDPPLSDRAKLHLDLKWLKNIKQLNFIVALPTLPLASYPTWTLRDNPFIKNVIEDVHRRYHQSESPLFLAGFSAGALHSLYTGLTGMFHVDGIIAFAYGLVDLHSHYLNADRNIPIFLAVGKFDPYVRANVRYSYRRLKTLKFRDVLYREYPIGHWVHDDFIKDLYVWINEKVVKINENREIALRHHSTDNRNIN